MVGLCALLLCTMPMQSQELYCHADRPDGHGPISVMGNHTHHKGGLMFSYVYMPMWMEGNMQGTESVSDEVIFENFMGAPQQMQMDMHMFMAMYAPTDRITLMAMGNYMVSKMDLKTRMGNEFRTTSKGLGDLLFSALVNLWNANRQAVHANVGVFLPTGNIDQRDDMPAGENMPLAYPMQLGSGTLDPYVGATYTGQSDRFSWGAQGLYRMVLAENEEDYALGDKVNATAWGAVRIADFMSSSLSVNYLQSGQINGADPDFNPMMMPLFNTNNSGRSQLNLGLGVNLLVPQGKMKNLRVAAEFKLPVMQKVNGIQMKNIYSGAVGVQYSLAKHAQH